MNGKQAKRLRKAVDYNPNKDYLREEGYNVEDTSRVLSAYVSGTNPDGSPKYDYLVLNQCTITMKPETKRAQYQALKTQ